MLLVHRQVNRFSINLAGAGKDYFYVRIETTAGFEQSKLRATIVFEVVERRGHRIEVAHVAGEIENEINAANQMIDDRRIANVGYVNSNAISDFVDVERIAALIFD